MYQSLFTNAMVSIVLGVLLPILYFVANHFIKEKKFLTVIILIVSVLSIAVGLRNLYYAKKPSIKTIVAKYDGVHQFGEAFGSTWYFVDNSGTLGICSLIQTSGHHRCSVASGCQVARSSPHVVAT